MTAAYWWGIATIPALALAATLAVWGWSRALLALDDWLLRAKPRRLRGVAHYSIADRRTYERLATRVGLAVAVSMAPRAWSTRLVPGHVVLIARDHRDIPGLDEAVKRAREAVADVVLPRDEDDR